MQNGILKTYTSNMNNLKDKEISLQRQEFNELNQLIHYRFQKGEITAKEMQSQAMQASKEYNEVVAKIMRDGRNN